MDRPLGRGRGRVTSQHLNRQPVVRILYTNDRTRSIAISTVSESSSSILSISADRGTSVVFFGRQLSNSRDGLGDLQPATRGPRRDLFCVLAVRPDGTERSRAELSSFRVSGQSPRKCALGRTWAPVREKSDRPNRTGGRDRRKTNHRSRRWSADPPRDGKMPSSAIRVGELTRRI